jgi:hypothetical protein
MKKSASFLVCVIALVSACGLALLGSGCEKVTGLQGLTITPSAVTLTPSTNTIVLAVTGVTNNLALPLAWSVEDSSLGTIVNSSGYTALYRSTDREGQNIVTARDQYDNEGFATITQIPDAPQGTNTAAAVFSEN